MRRDALTRSSIASLVIFFACLSSHVRLFQVLQSVALRFDCVGFISLVPLQGGYLSPPRHTIELR